MRLRAITEMRVLTQLTDHFMDQKQLKPDEIKHLLRHGFITPEDVKRYLQKYESDADHPIHQVVPTGTLKRAEERELTDEALEQLPEGDRELVRMALDGMNAKDIAAELQKQGQKATAYGVAMKIQKLMNWFKTRLRVLQNGG